MPGWSTNRGDGSSTGRKGGGRDGGWRVPELVQNWYDVGTVGLTTNSRWVNAWRCLSTTREREALIFISQSPIWWHDCEGMKTDETCRKATWLNIVWPRRSGWPLPADLKWSAGRSFITTDLVHPQTSLTINGHQGDGYASQKPRTVVKISGSQWSMSPLSMGASPSTPPPHPCSLTIIRDQSNQWNSLVQYEMKNIG